MRLGCSAIERPVGEPRAKLLTIDSVSMDRLVWEVRAVARGGRRSCAEMSSAMRHSVLARTFGDRNDPHSGYVEDDSGAHRHHFVR